MAKKIDNWRMIISDWEQSGQTQQEFCRKREIIYTQFTYWRKRIKKQEDALESNDKKKPAFVRHSLNTPINSTYIIEWSDGMRLNIPVHFGSDDLVDLIQKLRTHSL